MSDATTAIHKAFEALAAPERIRVVQELWDRIADENATDLPLTEEQKRLLDERLEAHERDPSAARPWKEVRKEILAKLGR